MRRPAAILLAAVYVLCVSARSASTGEEVVAPAVATGYDRAVALLQEGIVFEAIHELEQFTALSPEHEAARMLLARSLYRVRRESRAAEELSQVIRMNPDNMEAKRMLARIRVELGQRLDRTNHDAVLSYARLCAIPESYDRAADYYRLALDLEDDAPVHLEFARMLSWAGRYEDSLYHYDVFLNSNPEHADALLEQGRICNSAGRFTQAVASFERCLALRPEDVQAALDLARALIWSGREDEAVVRLDDMVRRQIGGNAPLILLASIARIRERPLDEYALLERVAAGSPEHAEAVERMHALEQGSLLEAARLSLHLDRHPDDLAVRRQLADLYVADARYGDALYQLARIHEAKPVDLEVTEMLQSVRTEEMRLVMDQVESFRHIREAERQREIGTLREWLEHNAGDMQSRSRLADLYMESGVFAEAVQQLEWLLAAAPDNTRLAQALSRAQALMKIQKDETAGTEDTP